MKTTTKKLMSLWLQATAFVVGVESLDLKVNPSRLSTLTPTPTSTSTSTSLQANNNNNNNHTGNMIHRRQSLLSLIAIISTTIGPAVVVQAKEDTTTTTTTTLPQQQRLEFRSNDATGVMVADIRLGNKIESEEGVGVVQPNSKVNIHLTGRLLGKNGWIFENSQLDGEPYRLQLGTNSIVPGLEWGLLGMAEGGKRRIVVPSEQGYLNRKLEPIPREFGNRQRLYTTVMNAGRINRERSQLGTDLAGRIIFDVELLRIR